MAIVMQKVRKKGTFWTQTPFEIEFSYEKIGSKWSLNRFLRGGGALNVKSPSPYLMSISEAPSCRVNQAEPKGAK